jgi:hypothetical protein
MTTGQRIAIGVGIGIAVGLIGGFLSGTLRNYGYASVATGIMVAVPGLIAGLVAATMKRQT